MFAIEIGLYGRLVYVAPLFCWPKSIWKRIGEQLLGIENGTLTDQVVVHDNAINVVGVLLLSLAKHATRSTRGYMGHPAIFYGQLVQ